MAVLSLKGGQNALCFFGQLSLTSKALCVFFHAQVLERVKQKKRKIMGKTLSSKSSPAHFKNGQNQIIKAQKSRCFFLLSQFWGWVTAQPQKGGTSGTTSEQKEVRPTDQPGVSRPSNMFCQAVFTFSKGLCLALRQPPNPVG